jgi:hypothetical protein
MYAVVSPVSLSSAGAFAQIRLYDERPGEGARNERCAAHDRDLDGRLAQAHRLGSRRS